MFGFGQLIEVLKKSPKKIVFTEGSDPRILEASSRLLASNFLHPILVGDPDEIEKAAEESGFNIRGAEIIDPKKFDRMDEMIDLFCELRKSKGVTPEQARGILSQANYFGTMLVKMGIADALLGGATYSTADTVRPALQLIKTKPGNSIVSSCFILVRPSATGENEVLAMSDCAINIHPTEDEKKYKQELKASASNSKELTKLNEKMTNLRSEKRKLDLDEQTLNPERAKGQLEKMENTDVAIHMLVNAKPELTKNPEFMKDLINRNMQYIEYDNSNEPELYMQYIEKMIQKLEEAKERNNANEFTINITINTAKKILEELNSPKEVEEGKYKIPRRFLFEGLRKSSKKDLELLEKGEMIDILSVGRDYLRKAAVASSNF